MARSESPVWRHAARQGEASLVAGGRRWGGLRPTLARLVTADRPNSIKGIVGSFCRCDIRWVIIFAATVPLVLRGRLFPFPLPSIDLAVFTPTPPDKQPSRSSHSLDTSLYPTTPDWLCVDFPNDTYK